MPNFPARYEPTVCLGRGGGGEVWEATDTLSGEPVALKVLSAEAGELERAALVREATALSGLEGLGVPVVLAFGTLPSTGQTYLVRELVRGESLDTYLTSDDPQWLSALCDSMNQVTVIHRAGLLHGDLKPANIIVGEGGQGTLVDLGLAAPLRAGGVRPRGLTPHYAAPELLRGAGLTVRAEVYSLGVTLRECLTRAVTSISTEANAALARVAAIATADDPETRFPSVDELESAVRAAAPLASHTAAAGRAPRTVRAWPIVGIEASAQALLQTAVGLGKGSALVVTGPTGAGKTTLLRRLSWTLGLEGHTVLLLEPKLSPALSHALLTHALSTQPVPSFILADDCRALTPASRTALQTYRDTGGRVVYGSAVPAHADDAASESFECAPLDDAAFAELLALTMPSLPKTLHAIVREQTAGFPGVLRALALSLEGRVIVSAADLGVPARAPGVHNEATAGANFSELTLLLDKGRFGEAKERLRGLTPTQPAARFACAMAEARIALATADLVAADAALRTSEPDVATTNDARIREVLLARVRLRSFDFAGADTHARRGFTEGVNDPIAIDAACVQAVALAYQGRDDEARLLLETIVKSASSMHHARSEALAYGSLAVVLQRLGQSIEAKTAYNRALAAAERAEDAWTVTTTRLNLATLARTEGDLALALVHLEAARDMGVRAGAASCVEQAQLNLANLDLFLGRHARAERTLRELALEGTRLSAQGRAQLAGLHAELADRKGDVGAAIEGYAACAADYDALLRPGDALEARLAGLLVELSARKRTAHELDRVYTSLIRDQVLNEHAARAHLLDGLLGEQLGDEGRARRALDSAADAGKTSGLFEITWLALDARARVLHAQGALALFRRDTETALSMLEDVASKLPRDLREVFWHDKRRAALRKAAANSVDGGAFGSPHEGGKQKSTLGASESGKRAARASGQTTLLGAHELPEDRLARIVEIMTELLRERDLDRLLARVTDHAIALVGAERGFLLLADDNGMLEPLTVRGPRGDEEHAKFSRSVAERVMESGEPVVATSARDDVRLAGAVSVHQLMIQSVACVPIRGPSPRLLPIGVLYLETRLRPAARFAGELSTLGAFADQAAIAIENARLLRELSARASELTTANQELEKTKARLAESLGRRTEQLHEVRRDLQKARAELRGHFGYAGLVGTSDAMRQMYAVLERVKDADVPVLITGESGTGKEIVAKAIHGQSARGKAPFIGVNCGAIPANLLESELFGHCRGAFTGAERDRKGLFREASGGTILLDEIGEMPMSMQAGLLRVLQEKTVRPLGAVKEEPVDVRIIAATNRDLEARIADNQFREDLYYRLHVVEIRVPSLRDRKDDIPLLVDHFLTLFASRYRRDKKGLDKSAHRALAQYGWPGNVRQLEHVLLNAWLLCDGEEIHADDIEFPSQPLRESSDHAGTSQVRVASTLPQNENDFARSERERILDALERSQWNRVQAAKLINMPRRTFYRRLKDYGIL